MIRIRNARLEDLSAIRELIPGSVRALSEGYYAPRQVESALAHVFGPDTVLIADGTYFVAETASGEVVGCGGWSRRRNLYGGDQLKSADPHATGDALLDPERDAARIRAFFVHPGHSRQGVGSRILQACADAARAVGFSRLELAATLPGVPFYLARGFQIRRHFTHTLPDGTEIAFVEMSGTVDSIHA